MASSNKRTWLWVIAGVFGTIFLFFVLLIGGAVYMFRTHVRNESNIESTTAERQFDEQRARFRGQQPLVEFTGDEHGDDDATVHRPAPDAPRVKINSVRVLIYDLRNGHLIHVDVPGWFIRLMPDSRFGGFQGDEEIRRHRITIEDIERHGLGLIVDGKNPNTRILIWSE
jgi:hypothetical protein